MAPRRVLILGATSAIAQAVARVYAAQGARLALVARNRQFLDVVAADLRVRGATALWTETADLLDLARHAALVDQAEQALGGLDVALVAHGMLPEQAEAVADPRIAEACWRTNFVSAAALLEALARRMEEVGAGTLGVLSSVAGERGMARNYVYGASKAALTAYASGLGQRLAAKGVRVVTVKPGPVATPMTAGRVTRTGLLADVDDVGRRIHRGLEAGWAVVYAPAYWRWVMAIIRLLPTWLFNRTRT
ncbi:MAG TPA: SDR family NAD(P)-dependent oxidoreductase [Myxococcaceae bacterium]|nr:SDR family NAD(P)-dependent oxidoreductase [Myxococcaceae bacterium]